MPIGRLQTEADLQRFFSQQLTEQFGVLNFHRIAGQVPDSKLVPPESVRLVGATGEPAFHNGWANRGSPWEVLGFYKWGSWVFIRGNVNSASVTGPAMFTLPAEYRPPAHLNFGVSRGTSGGAGTVSVFAGGPVSCNPFDPAADFDINLSFRVDE